LPDCPGNIASGDWSTVGGGTRNTAGIGDFSTVGGGFLNIASNDFATIGGGLENTARRASTVGGGSGNDAIGDRSTIGGGISNLADGKFATVPGGERNVATGDNSFAAGKKAHALHKGAFVWASTSPNFPFESTADDEFSVRAPGGTRIFSDASVTIGVLLAPNTNGWGMISDYRLKDNISEYSVLDKLDDYRAVEFDWKASGNHDVGVMAQELQSIFPELVNTGSAQGDIANAAFSGVWSVQYSKLGALALQAIKEQQTQIEALIDIICADNPDRQICIEN